MSSVFKLCLLQVHDLSNLMYYSQRFVIYEHVRYATGALKEFSNMIVIVFVGAVKKFITRN